ncbi:uncharacterized protein LOC134258281 [Saccostrea cucullata]|uniref:uncharacterized protein LOC134258281 n=1 Tax=Saccostrea cuccullata TaxID=36930 RepID=UPI002ED6945B
MSSPRFYSCVLCSSRPKARDRRPLTGSKNKGLRKFLQRRFLIESSKIFATASVICNKCRLRCSREIHAAAGDSQKDFAKQNRIPDTDLGTEYIPSTKKAKKIPKSPPSITLPIPSVGGSHSQCAVCKRRGPKLVVVPKNARYNLFLETLIVLPIGARCCPGHLSENLFHAHAAEQISQSRTTSDFNRSDLMELITEIREIAVRGSEKRIDFDNVKSLSDSDVLTLTGITKKNFDELCSEVGGSLRDSSTRSVRTCIGIFLTKLKTGMPNKIIQFRQRLNPTCHCISAEVSFTTFCAITSGFWAYKQRRNNIIAYETNSTIIIWRRQVSSHISSRRNLHIHTEEFTVQIPTQVLQFT